MGAGLSMASVNKIKELANSKEYSLALELVEHQDLTKSLNPQFLRLCGEIYIKNERYADARRCLIMAHRLGPESKRIIFTFVELYLRMGYFKLAKTYYEMYMFDAGNYDSRQMEYVWQKHEHFGEWDVLEPMLAPYAHNLDYDWSFELYLLYKKAGKQDEAKMLAELYHASFKNSENSQIIQNIEAGNESADTYFDIYKLTESEDDEPEYEELRKEEQELLAADDLRMHPKEAEITVMYEDAYTPAGSEKKVQRMLRKQDREEERREKKLQKKQKQADDEVAVSDEAEKKSIFGKLFGKKHIDDNSEETVQSEQPGEIKDTAKPEETAETKETAKPEEAAETKETAKPEETAETKETAKPEGTDTITTGQAEDMIHRKSTIANNVVVVDEDDGFEAEAETVEQLAEQTEKDSADGKEQRKASYVFQTVELAPEDFDDQYVVDDFSDKTDDGFGEMKQYEKTEHIDEEEPEPEIIEEEPEEEPEPETIEEEPEPETIEEEPEEEPEPETIEEELEEEPEPETIEEEPEPETIEEEPEKEPEPEEIEEKSEEEPESEIIEEEPEKEPEPETIEEEPEEEPKPETIEEEPEEEPEPETIEEEPEEEPKPETIEEEPEEEPEPETIEEEPEEEPEPETIEEEPELETIVEEPEPEQSFRVAPFTTKPQKKKLDFPVFKSSLFPDYHKNIKQVENNFDEIMDEAHDKMTENMLKEEQMQREAEELLASLGISMDSIPVTKKTVPNVEQPKPKGPSRDELKASLKIDSNKKNLLKRIKEYR